MKTVYKVVRIINGRYVSPVVYGDPHNIVYRVGELVRPSVGYIMAFDSLPNARCFYNRGRVFGGKFRIFRAVAGSATPLSIVSVDYRPHAIAKFWESYSAPNTDFQGLCTTPAPEGTLACTSLKLLEVVYE